MPEATKDIHDSKAPAGDLDVSEMLADLAIDAPAAPAAPPAATPVVAAPPSSPAAIPTPNGTPAPAATPPQAPAPDPLLDQVNALLEHPAAPAGAEQDAPSLDLALDAQLPESEAPAEALAQPAAPIPEKKIESLDAELATIADELISVEFKDEPAPISDNELAEVAAPLPTTPATTPAPPAVRTPIPAPPKAVPSPSPAEPAPAAPAPRWKRTLAKVLAPAARALLPLAALISRPLAKRPAQIRDIVGWNALWVGFLALCLWVYVLFIRSPEPPVPSLEPSRTHQTSSKPEAEHTDGKKPDKKQDKKPADKKPAKEASAAKH